MYISIAVRAVEAWLMADYKEFARHLHIREGRIPKKPEEEENPKRTIVNLARNSRSSMIKREVVPSQKSGRSKGNGYEDIMIEFVQKKWCPVHASQRAPSLAHALERCQALFAASDN